MIGSGCPRWTLLATLQATLVGNSRPLSKNSDSDVVGEFYFIILVYIKLASVTSTNKKNTWRLWVSKQAGVLEGGERGRGPVQLAAEQALTPAPNQATISWHCLLVSEFIQFFKNTYDVEWLYTAHTESLSWFLNQEWPISCPPNTSS